MRVAFCLLCFFPLVCFAKTEKLVFDDYSMNVMFDSKQPVVFVGKKSIDSSGMEMAPIMYPGDTAGLFLASILAHAAISGGAQKAKLNREQEEANKVLDPYKPYIAHINEEFLVQSTTSGVAPTVAEHMRFLLGDEHLETSRWQINVVPVFAMAQNQSSFFIYNKLTFIDRSLTPKDKRKLRKTKKGQINPNEKLVVIVSDPVLTENNADFWLGENAKQFNQSIKSLYLESLNLGLERHFGGLQNANTKQVTIKYLEDGVKKIERGYVISQTCKRTVFESLVGEIKSVPNLEFASCGMS